MDELDEELDIRQKLSDEFGQMNRIQEEKRIKCKESMTRSQMYT